MINKKNQNWFVTIRYEDKFCTLVFKKEKHAIKFYDLVTFVEIYHPELLISHAIPILTLKEKEEE